MSKARLSAHFEGRQPSAIRLAQIEFMKRTDDVLAVNTAIGNVSLPMHPAMQKRLTKLGKEGSPFAGGVVKYSATVGFEETQQAIMNIIASSGYNTETLRALITDGGSAAMELLLVGVCGPSGSSESPLLLIDAAYTNYKALAQRTGRSTVSVQRTLGSDGKFSLPDMADIEAVIKEHQPGALVVIPYDNPTGHYYDHATMMQLCELCVKYNMWIASDEAYRELFYTDDEASSIWKVTDSEVPGIEGRRISIETSSKVWNACGLRIGALVTDNKEFHAKAVAEYTANLCSNVIGQYIFGSLAHESHSDLQYWYTRQRGYYCELMSSVSNKLKQALPGLIVSSPDASIYSVVDVRDIAPPDFDAQAFVMYCAQKGVVPINNKKYTLLVSPMAGFYQPKECNDANPGCTQMRIAYVEPPDKMAMVPQLFAALFKQYIS